MSGKLENKIAIVTGGTGALGRHIVNKFVDEGAKVYVPSTSLESFNDVFDNSQNYDGGEFKVKKIFSFVCDATNENSVKDFVESVSVQEQDRIDFLINTVGGIHGNITIDSLSTDDFNKFMSLNFFSTFFFSREVLKIMQKNNYGRIVSIGAIAALQTTVGKFAYSVSKQAVINLMNTISSENKDLNIRANTIVPGIIDTPANRQWGSEDEVKKWVKPTDIANIIVDFLKPDHDSVRESIIKVYGSF